jgi:hypothetical protein
MLSVTFAECHIKALYAVIRLNFVMLNVVMLYVIMLSVIMLTQHENIQHNVAPLNCGFKLQLLRSTDLKKGSTVRFLTLAIVTGMVCHN